MKELTNIASASGLYNNLETVIESNENSIQLINNLEIKKEVNKDIWTNGNLQYTLVIENITSGKFTNVQIIDILEPNFVSLIPNSVYINNIPTSYGTFTYDEKTGELRINLSNINSNEVVRIFFQVKKKRKEIFKIENYATVIFNENINISNVVTTIALSEICRCNNLNRIK